MGEVQEDLIRRIVAKESRELEKVVRAFVEGGSKKDLVRSAVPGGLAWSVKERIA